MSAADHIASTIATIRKQVDGAERRIAEGNALDASGPIAGAISRLASLQVELARLDGYETARREAKAQAKLDANVRVMRGRDAIVAVLRSWRDGEPTHRANNIATGLAGAGPGDDALGQLRDALRDEHGAYAAQIAGEVLCAWVRTERAPIDIDAEGPCRAGDESRCPEHTEMPDTTPPPAPIAPTVADLERLWTDAASHAGDAA